MAEIGITVYFRAGRVYIRKKTIYALDNPEYIHLSMNEKKKQMFIQKCEKDKDAFRLYYKVEKGKARAERCYINAQHLTKYLARLVDVEYPSNSLWFKGRLLEDHETVFIDLSDYTEIQYNNDEDTDERDDNQDNDAFRA